MTALEIMALVRAQTDAAAHLCMANAWDDDAPEIVERSLDASLAASAAIANVCCERDEALAEVARLNALLDMTRDGIERIRQSIFESGAST